MSLSDGATFSIMMEIFSQSSRPAAFTVGGCLNWAGLFVVGIAFPFAEESLGPFCFLLFATVLSGSGIFFYLFLPETKGKSTVEITEEFSRSSLGKKLTVLGKIFRKLHHFSFLIFMGSLYTSGFIIYFFLPETKKKSILEIREEFDKVNFKKKQIPILEAKLTKDHELCTKL
ncbi:hypothetical protein Chor_000080 [Crotalus horridus]